MNFVCDAAAELVMSLAGHGEAKAVDAALLEGNRVTGEMVVAPGALTMKELQAILAKPLRTVLCSFAHLRRRVDWTRCASAEQASRGRSLSPALAPL